MRPIDDVYSSVITEGELLFGILNARPSNRERLAEQIQRSLAAMTAIVPVTRAAARAYGAIRSDLKLKGRLLPDNDLWIAAVALANEYTLVSHDSGFGHIPGLKLEDWLAPQQLLRFVDSLAALGYDRDGRFPKESLVKLRCDDAFNDR